MIITRIFLSSQVLCQLALYSLAYLRYNVLSERDRMHALNVLILLLLALGGYQALALAAQVERYTQGQPGTSTRYLQSWGVFPAPTSKKREYHGVAQHSDGSPASGHAAFGAAPRSGRRPPSPCPFGVQSLP